MPSQCVVFVPNPKGGYLFYEPYASGSYDAAWQAIQGHERILKTKLPDDLVLQVVVDGKNSLAADFREHNARQPNFWVRVGQVRESANLVRS